MTDALRNQLLALHALLINKYGADSQEVKEFALRYQGDPKFKELAQMAKDLKKALAFR